MPLSGHRAAFLIDKEKLGVVVDYLMAWGQACRFGSFINLQPPTSLQEFRQQSKFRRAPATSRSSSNLVKKGCLSFSRSQSRPHTLLARSFSSPPLQVVLLRKHTRFNLRDLGTEYLDIRVGTLKSRKRHFWVSNAHINWKCV